MKVVRLNEKKKSIRLRLAASGFLLFILPVRVLPSYRIEMYNVHAKKQFSLHHEFNVANLRCTYAIPFRFNATAIFSTALRPTALARYLF